MSGGAAFNWSSLGKADYAQAAALVASLPSDVRSEIKGVSDEILRRLVYLMWYRAYHSGRGAAYCYPTLATIGKWCGRAVRTVQRHIAQLVEAGLIVTKERHKAGGVNTSSLFICGPRFLASLFARKNRKSSTKWPTTKMSDNDLKREYKAGAEVERHAICEKTQTKQPAVSDQLSPAHKPYTVPEWMSHRVASTLSLVATGSDDTAWDSEPEKPEVARKALLKAQAERLKAQGL